MYSSALSTVTAKNLLHSWQEGDQGAKNKLFDLLYNELRQISRAYLSRERCISLASSDLVHEASLRLLQLDQIDWQNRSHFLALASTCMRRVLVDHVRRKMAQKRDAIEVTLTHNCAQDGQENLDLLELDSALSALEEIDPQRSKIVEMRFFGGLSLDEIAVAVGMSKSTIKRQWRSSRAWLHDHLSTI